MARLTPSVNAIVAATVAGGVGCLAIAGANARSIAHMTASQWTVAGAVAVLAAGSWVWPLVLFRKNQSQAFHLDEGFIVMLALLVPPAATISVLALSTIAAQVIRRRQALKSVFNLGEVVIGLTLALAVSRSIAVPGRHPSAGAVGAATLGALVYFTVSSTLVSSVLVAMGSTWRECLVNDMFVQFGLAVSGVLLGSILALSVAARPWTLAMAVPVLVILRIVVAAQFTAQHDRARMKGLFDVALDATSQSLRPEAVVDSILTSARSLLRSPDASLSVDRPEPDTMAARLDIAGSPQWLVVAGRKREEPFDEADQILLDAIAAIGKGALTNAELYGQVRYEQKRLSSITLNIGEGVCAVDADGLLTFVNPAAADMIEVPSLGALVEDGMNRDALLAPAFLLGPAKEAMSTGRVVRDGDARFTGRDGRSMPVEYTASVVHDQGKVTGAVIAFRDVTERKALQDQLERHASVDSLTGLPNRRVLVDRLNAALGRSALDRKTHALIFVDVDRFKNVNDSLGHTTGNDLLEQVAQRMKGAVGQRDLIARFGGDEFVALVEDVAGIEEAIAAARRICAAVERPLILAGGYEHVASVSVGIALTEPNSSADDVLRNADVAMYEAKTKGGGAYKVFDLAAMGPRSRKRLDLEAALRRGIERGELEVHYQPYFSVDDEQIVGAEALVRWRHPTEGLVRPDEFIPMAEDTGLILPLGRQVLEQACQQSRRIRDLLGLSLTMSVNLSPRQFQHAGLLSEVASALDAAGLPSDAITFEITEAMVMGDVDGASDVMKKLSRLGVGLAVDDFLVEHSTFSYLKQFPVNEVKIDRAFVQGVATDPVDSAIVQAIVRLADALCIEAIAEGVETPEQLAGLKMLGCPVAQGYYLAKPMPSGEFEAMLVERLAPHAKDVTGKKDSVIRLHNPRIAG